MNDPVTVRLYEKPDRPADKHPGTYRPAEPGGWDYAVGDDLPVEDGHGQYVIGTVTAVDADVHHDDDGSRYRVVTVLLKD